MHLQVFFAKIFIGKILCVSCKFLVTVVHLLLCNHCGNKFYIFLDCQRNSKFWNGNSYKNKIFGQKITFFISVVPNLQEARNDVLSACLCSVFLQKHEV